MAMDLGKVTLSLVIDRPGLDRAREALQRELADVHPDPVVVAEVVRAVVETAPVVRWVAT